MADLAFSPVETTLTHVDTCWRSHLEAKLVKVNKRLAKLGAPPAALTFGEVAEREERDDWTGFKRVWREFDTVTVTGVEAKFAGWTGVATLDHSLLPVGWVQTDSEAEALVSKFPGQEDTEVPDRFRFRGPVCDHCGVEIRTRKLTILFVNESGDWMQVGTSCVRDFIGVDPATVLWLAAPAFGGSDDEEMFSSGGSREVPPLEFLIAAAEVTRLFGFVKSRPDSAYDTPTRQECNTLCRYRLTDADKKRYADVDYARGEAEARKIIAWVESSADGSDFMRSARIAVTAWKVNDKTEGILAALPFCYMREMGRIADREAKAAAKPGRPDDFVGEVGAKLTVEGVVTFRDVFEPYHVYGPPSYLVVVTTDTGHVVKTLGSGQTLWQAEVGDRITMTGKVKELDDHAVYGKATVLKMAKIVVLAHGGEEAA